MPARIGIAGWIGSDNLGDELILQHIAADLVERGCSPVAISIDPQATEELHGIEAIRHRGPRDARTLDQALRRMDGVVFGGGGLLQDETSPWNLPFHLSRVRQAVGRGVPVTGLGLGVGSIQGRLAQRLVPRLLPHLATVAVRDSDSAARLAALGVSGALIGADPAFSTAARPAPASATVAVLMRRPNRRGLMPAARRGAAESVDSAFLDSVADGVDRVATALGASIRMISMQPSRDGPLHRQLAARMRAPVETITPELDSVMSLVADCRAVITMRYHGAIAALLHGKPTVLLDYSPKMGGLADEGNGWAPTVDLASLGGEAMLTALEAADRLVENAPAALAEVRARLAVNRSALDEFLAGIR